MYDRYKRYAKSFFDKIDEITSYSHYKPSKLQENYDEQYLSEERKDVLRLTLIDAHLEVPIAEQIIKRKTTKKMET